MSYQMVTEQNGELYLFRTVGTELYVLTDILQSPRGADHSGRACAIGRARRVAKVTHCAAREQPSLAVLA